AHPGSRGSAARTGLRQATSRSPGKSPEVMSAVVVGAGEVLAVPADRLKELVARDPAIGDLILRAYLLRRSILIELGAGLRIVGSKYSPDTRRVRDFAA